MEYSDAPRQAFVKPKRNLAYCDAWNWMRRQHCPLTYRPSQNSTILSKPTSARQVIKKWLNQQSEFRKHTFILLSGTVIAQILPVVFAPVLSRVFNAADIGLFAVFQSACFVLAVPVNLRYNLCLLLPERDEDAFNLMGLCIILATAWTALLELLTLAFREPLGQWMGEQRMTSWFFLVPIAVWINGLYSAYYGWFNRRRGFRQMATSKIVQSVSIILVALLIGVLSGGGATGLILGFLVGQFGSLLYLAVTVYASERGIWSTLNLRQMWTLATRYRDFPTYSLPADLLNAVSNQMPVFLLQSYFGRSVVGFYNWTFQITLGPLNMIATAMVDVFKEKAARDYREKGHCRDVYLKTAKTLALIVIPPLAILYPLAPDLFAFVFGESWRTSGEYAQILIPLFVIRFIASPLSYVVYIAERQSVDFVWQIIVFLCVLGAFVIGGEQGDVELALRLFCLVYSAAYGVYIWMNYQFAKGTMKRS